MQTIIKRLKNGISCELDIPGDKSISHRSVIFSSIIPGKTTIKNFLQGEDCKHTLEAFEAMGVKSEFKDDLLIIEGKRMDRLIPPKEDIYLGNSGTSIRLLSGLFSSLNFPTTLTGDASLLKRPMNRVIKPLEEMGSEIESQEAGLAPLRINGNDLKAINYQSPIASAQVKSCILLAALGAEGETVISEPHLSRDHTERMLKFFGADLEISDNTIKFKGKENYEKLCYEAEDREIFVPGDISSAAFFMVAAAILEDSEITVKNIGLNPSRTGILEAFDLMNVDYEILNSKEVNNEPIADIKVRSSKIKAAEIGGELIPKLIDEIPIISILAAQAEGTTVIKDAEELKVKESNRIASTLNMLQKLKVDAKEKPDGMVIEGRNKKAFETSNLVEIDSHGDHRLAMSSAIAGLYAENPIEILKTEFVQTSFPNFFDLLENLKQASKLST